jgi:RNA polymerase sigma-70 factor, ECF subfamily
MTDTSHDLAGAVQASWKRFLESYEPLRPMLYRYCRYLTRSPWDAEDLAQDVLARAFATLGRLSEPPRSPQAWLYRIASNLWIDRVRSAAARPDALALSPVDEVETAGAAPDPRAAREAAGTLLTQLAPQERAAVVLKDVFDLPLDEIAEVLSTTVGAVKAALHRGRGKLAEPAAEPDRVPVPAALDAFCAAFNARDLDRVAAILLDTATVEVVGASTIYGRERARGTVLVGMLFGSKRMAAPAEGGSGDGMDPRFAQGVLPEPARFELRTHRGQLLLLSWYVHRDGELVRAVSTVELDADGAHVARLKNYFYTPEVIAEVCNELGLPHRVNGTFRARGDA